jgi:hypothetical protein
LVIGDLYLPPEPDTPIREQPHNGGMKPNPTYTWSSMYSKVFDRATPIRFKILNGNFLVTDTFHFSYYTLNASGVPVETLLPVTIIGSDSTLFKDFVPGVTSWSLGAAERLDMILDLSQIPASCENFSFYVEAIDDLNVPDADLNLTRTFFLSECYVDPCVTSYPTIPSSFPSMPPFVNLTSFYPDKMRFRVLDWYPIFAENVFDYYINGHSDFMHGAV